MKKITICDKEYDVSCNAFTRFQYKKIFGKGIFADIKTISEFSENQEKIRKELTQKGLSNEEIDKEVNLYMMENLDDFIDVVERIAYILIYSAKTAPGYTGNGSTESFEDWLKGLEKIDLSASWISEVTELAVSSFC